MVIGKIILIPQSIKEYYQLFIFNVCYYFDLEKKLTQFLNKTRNKLNLSITKKTRTLSSYATALKMYGLLEIKYRTLSASAKLSIKI